MSDQKRREKYPNTEVFEYFNANPKNRLTSDCVVRAISTATDRSYYTVVTDLADIQMRTGYDSHSNQAIAKLMDRYGWIKHAQPKKSDGTKFTGAEFARRTVESVCVANIGGHHIVCIKDHKVFDTWDCTGKCVGNYWTRKGGD